MLLTMRTFNYADNLIKCILKILLHKTRSSSSTFMRAIHKTGKHLLKYNNLYSPHLVSGVDTRLQTLSRDLTAAVQDIWSSAYAAV